MASRGRCVPSRGSRKRCEGPGSSVPKPSRSHSLSGVSQTFQSFLALSSSVFSSMTETQGRSSVSASQGREHDRTEIRWHCRAHDEKTSSQMAKLSDHRDDKTERVRFVGVNLVNHDRRVCGGELLQGPVTSVE